MAYEIVSDQTIVLPGGAGAAGTGDYSVTHQVGDVVLVQAYRRNVATVGTFSILSGTLPSFTQLGEYLNSANNSTGAYATIATTNDTSVVRAVTSGGASVNQVMNGSVTLIRGLDVSGGTVAALTHTSWASNFANADPITVPSRTVSANGLDCLWFATVGANTRVMATAVTHGIQTTNGYTQMNRLNTDITSPAVATEPSYSSGYKVVGSGQASQDATCELSAAVLSVYQSFGLKIAIQRTPDLSGICDASY